MTEIFFFPEAWVMPTFKGRAEKEEPEKQK